MKIYDVLEYLLKNQASGGGGEGKEYISFALCNTRTIATGITYYFVVERQDGLYSFEDYINASENGYLLDTTGECKIYLESGQYWQNNPLTAIFTTGAWNPSNLNDSTGTIYEDTPIEPNQTYLADISIQVL